MVYTGDYYPPTCWHLAAAGRKCASWWACRILWDDSDRHNQSEVQNLSVQPGI